MNHTSRATYSDPTRDPSQLTALEIALSRCSWCPTAVSDEYDGIVASEHSYNDSHLFSDRDLRITQTQRYEHLESTADVSCDLKMGYELAVAV